MCTLYSLCLSLWLSALQLKSWWLKRARAQVRGRTKSLFSTMKKLLRLDDMAKGGRAREEVYDLLGMRVVVAPLPGMPPETAAMAATQASLARCEEALETAFQGPTPFAKC